MSKPKAPAVIDLDNKSKPKSKSVKLPTPAEALPILDASPQGEAMQLATKFAARKPSGMMRLFAFAIMSLVGFMISIAFWDFISALFTRNIWLGRIGMALAVISVFCILLFVLKEVRAFLRLGKMDRLQRRSEQLWAHGTRRDAQRHVGKITKLISNKPELAWALADFKERQDELLDTSAILGHAEQTLILPMDKLAQKEIEKAARQVATATAILPMALLDVAVALGANVRMIRKIAEVYGGRAGSFGSWRLLKSVAGHLIATGAVAIGDDLLGSIAGGGALSKISRRFGEGLVNSALTARVGIAAMEVCRPMPFKTVVQPSVTGIVKNALVGFWNSEKSKKFKGIS